MGPAVDAPWIWEGGVLSTSLHNSSIHIPFHSSSEARWGGDHSGGGGVAIKVKYVCWLGVRAVVGGGGALNERKANSNKCRKIAINKVMHSTV